jgi:hypothetical protein
LGDIWLGFKSVQHFISSRVAFSRGVCTCVPQLVIEHLSLLQFCATSVSFREGIGDHQQTHGQFSTVFGRKTAHIFLQLHVGIFEPPLRVYFVPFCESDVMWSRDGDTHSLQTTSIKCFQSLLPSIIPGVLLPLHKVGLAARGGAEMPL